MSSRQPAPESGQPGAEDRQLAQLRADVDSVERRVAGEIDPGIRAVVVAVLVVVLAGSLALPHAGSAHGYDVLLSNAAATHDLIRLPSKIFAWLVAVFGVLCSALALVSQRWVLAWTALAGSALASVFGVLAIWTRQTPGLGNIKGAGPGIGLIIGTITAMLLTFHWLRVVWSRTALQLAAEAARRAAAAECERGSGLL